MRYTIGLDVGIASMGWAVINNEKSRIENLGVKLFKKAENDKGKSLNSERREAKGTRIRLRRRVTRMKKVKELFIKYNLVSEKELEDLYVKTNETKDVWELRAIGLNQLLDRKEWARVLTSIAKRRGYKSNRKIDEEDIEVGRLSKGTLENKRLLEAKGYKTIGEMFYKDEKFALNKRNKAGEYYNTVLRSMLIEEVHILFASQRKYNSNYASEDFEKEYVEIITFQKPFLTPELLNKMLGKCTFEKNMYRAPKNSYTFERFTLLQKINNLNIQINGKKLEILPEQREEIIKMAYEKSEIKYSQLRKILNLPEDAMFENVNYNIAKKQNNLSETEMIKKAENIKFIKLEGWDKIKTELKKINCEEKLEIIKNNYKVQNIIADALIRNKTDESIKKYLKARNIDDKLIEVSLKINFTKVGHLSYKAMKKIIPQLEKGLTYDKACTEAGYNFKGKANELQKKLPPVSKINDDILNPVVLRSVSQLRKLVNGIITQYGSPTAIYIEVARELSKNHDERKKIEMQQKENYEKNERIKEEIKETFKFEPKPFDIVKMKLWKEQAGKCAYSQKSIPAERLYEENFVQVDHIIPFSRCFDDSYNNKVLVLSDENQKKKEKTPYEYFGQDSARWHKFEEFVNLTYRKNVRKKEHLLMKDFNENKSKEWLSRNINDTRYIAKYIYNYITNNLKFADSELKRKVYTINGATTATLRHYWGLKKDREESDKHHALDAVVIACATNENIKKISDYSRKKNLYVKEQYKDANTGEIINSKYNLDITIKEPWPRFREEVEARLEEPDNNGQLYSLINGQFTNYDDIDITKVKPIFIVRTPERKVTGSAHDATMRSLKFVNKGEDYTVVKKSLKEIRKKDIEKIISDKQFRDLYISDKIMYDDIYKKMEEGKFNAEEYRKYSKKGNGPIVRSIKVPSVGKSGVKLKNNSIAQNANIVRTDVFSKGNKFYMVPIYVSNFVKDKLPNKAIVGSKDESDWIEMTNEYEFKFSLYPNDLIKYKEKNKKEVFAYYTGVNRSNGVLKLILQNGDTKEIGARTLNILEKYQVDVLGNISKVKKEKRQGVKEK